MKEQGRDIEKKYDNFKWSIFAIIICLAILTISFILSLPICN